MDEDAQFFSIHRDRYAHIRSPRLQLIRLPSRQVKYIPEMQGEFWSLGEHNKERERILVWRVPEHHPMYDSKETKLLRIPFLLFTDESVEDTDAVLLPIIHQIMTDAARKQGAQV
jgi:hypothetical protein